MADNKPATETRDPRALRVGFVTSSVRDKTITVSIASMVRHPKYGKFMRRTAKLQAHDEKNEASKGDRVEIMACRPLSKTKAWRLVRILDRAPQEAHA